jgi:hypothetical protein
VGRIGGMSNPPPLPEEYFARFRKPPKKTLPILAAVVGVVCLVFICNRHEGSTEEDRAYAWELVNEASKWRVDPATIRDARLIALGRADLYEIAVKTMHDIASAGANASPSLLSMKTTLDDLLHDPGRPPESEEDRKAFNTRMMALAGERRMQLTNNPRP